MSNFVTALINLGYFLLFHMFQTHVSKRENLLCVNFCIDFLTLRQFLPPPLLFRIVYSIFTPHCVCPQPQGL